MTINDEFFKKTQENLRRIKAQNNKKTMKNYNIDGKAEAQNLSEPQQTQQEDNDNVIVVDFKRKKSLNTPAALKKEVSPEERMERIRQSIQNINALMKELNERNTK